MKEVEESQFVVEPRNRCPVALLFTEDVTIERLRPVMTLNPHWARVAHEAVSLEPREK